MGSPLEPAFLELLVAFGLAAVFAQRLALVEMTAGYQPEPAVVLRFEALWVEQAPHDCGTKRS